MQKTIPKDSRDIPEPLPLIKLIGPSFIILAAGLGSGEVILWPYLASNFGLGIMWAAVLGISFQFFLNMEIERYSLVTGESIFVGLTRRFGKFAPIWFMVTSFLPWIWPGIIASSAKVLSASVGINYSGVVGIILLLVMGALFSLGHLIYKTQELVQKTIIVIGVPFIAFLTFYLAKNSDWLALFQGVLGNGETAKGLVYQFIPAGLPIATFLAAFAYSGSGGNLNLAQSFYIKEKGYGMGKYFGKITNALFHKKDEVELTGGTFPETAENINRFNKWWKLINIEHGTIFWLIGALSMLFLALLSYSTVFGKSGIETSINFVIQEGGAIAGKTLPLIGTAFLFVAGIMLFGTQFSIYGSTSRIISENLILASPNRFKTSNISKYFFVFLWLQIIAGIVVFSLGFTEPLGLVVTGAIMNAVSMFIYTGMVLYLNSTLLPKSVQPSLFRKIAVLIGFAFYGAFSLYTLIQNFSALL